MAPPNGTRMMMAPGAGAARVSTPAHPGLDETLVEPGDRVISVLPTNQQHYSIPESFGADV